MEDIIIEEKPSKVITLGILGLFMIVLSAVILICGIVQNKHHNIFLGVVGIVLFGVCTFFIYHRCLKMKPLLVIKTDGIEDYSITSMVGFISFGDIKAFSIANYFGQRVIAVHLKNTEEFIERLPMVKRRAAKANYAMRMSPVAIRVDLARDMSIEDILSLLQKRLSDYSKLYD